MLFCYASLALCAVTSSNDASCHVAVLSEEAEINANSTLLVQIGIILSSLGVLSLSAFNFLQIVELLNIIYCLAELMEFVAFIYLRYKAPDLVRCALLFTVIMASKGCLLNTGHACRKVTLDLENVYLVAKAVAITAVLLQRMWRWTD